MAAEQGMKVRMKKTRFKSCIPAVIVGNVRSLANIYGRTGSAHQEPEREQEVLYYLFYGDVTAGLDTELCCESSLLPHGRSVFIQEKPKIAFFRWLRSFNLCNQMLLMF